MWTFESSESHVRCFRDNGQPAHRLMSLFLLLWTNQNKLQMMSHTTSPPASANSSQQWTWCDLQEVNPIYSQQGWTLTNRALPSICVHIPDQNRSFCWCPSTCPGWSQCPGQILSVFNNKRRKTFASRVNTKNYYDRRGLTLSDFNSLSDNRYSINTATVMWL